MRDKISMSLSDIQDWLDDQGQPSRLDEETCAAAAADGRLDVLQILRAQQPPCAWDSRSCTAAAFHGHLAVLQWLRQQTPPCPWSPSTSDAAASQGHCDIYHWLLKQTLPCVHAPRPEHFHLNILKCFAAALPLEGRHHILLPAACVAARRKDREVMEWVTSLEPDFTSSICKQLLLRGWTCGISFMHSIGCLEIGTEPQATSRELLMWPAMMGDFAAVKDMEGVLRAHRAFVQSICAACEGRVTSIVHYKGSLHEGQLRYWKDRPGSPEFLLMAEWLLDFVGGIMPTDYLDANWPAGNALLLVEMQAISPKCDPAVCWSAATHSFAAAHAAPFALRWLLRQQGLAHEYTTVHLDCSSARMLLLVHGHGWHLPAQQEEQLEIAEKRRLAFYAAVRQQQQRQQQQQVKCTACLGTLPTELLKFIAWKADIDFSWSLCDSQRV